MPPDSPPDADNTPPASAPQVAIRRWGDACFHRVDEVVEEGFILGSVLVSRDDVLEVIEVGADEACPRRIAELRLPPLRKNG